MQSSPDSSMQPRNSGSFTTKQGGTFISTAATAANNKSGGIKSSNAYTSVPSENTHGSNQLLISPQNDSALPMFGAHT